MRTVEMKIVIPENGGLWFASGCYDDDGDDSSVADLHYYDDVDYNFDFGVGVIALD